MREIKLVQDNEPQILILKEKHGNSYYIVNSEKELHDICVDVLKDRLQRGFYDVDEESDEELGFESEEQIQNLPDGIIKDKALGIWRDYEKCNLAIAKDREFKDRVKKAINYEFNPEAHIYVRNQAYYCLTEREIYEYEKMSLQVPTNVMRRHLRLKK